MNKTTAILAAALLSFAGLAQADSDTVTYVESVSCTAGVCEVRHRTEPVEQTVRERYAGNICLEYTRRITGVRKVQSLDPLTPIELPQYVNGQARQSRCEQASARLLSGG